MDARINITILFLKNKINKKKIIKLILVILSILLLLLYWHAFYAPIWSGLRHVGYDLDGYNFPLDSYLFTALQQTHHITQLDLYSFNGVDFVGNIQAAIFYPPKLVWMVSKVILNSPFTFLSYQYFYLLHVLLFSVLIFLVALKYLKSFIASLILAITGTYNGFIQANIQHLWFFLSIAWIPLIFLGLIEGIIKGKKSGILFFVIGTIFMLLAGFPLEFIAVYSALIVGLFAYLLAHKTKYPIKRILLRLIISNIFVLLISAIQILPSAQDYILADANAFEGHLHTLSFITMLLPNYFGHLVGPLTKPWDPTTSFFYIGLPLVVGTIAWIIVLVSKALRKKVNATLAIILLSLVVVSFVLTFLPIIDYVHANISNLSGAFRPWMIAIVLMLSLSIFLVYPLSIFCRQKSTFLKALMVIVLIAFAINLRTDMPAFFNTPTGSGSIISVQNNTPASPRVYTQLKNINYSMLVNQSNVGGYMDDWPRLWKIRSLGGHDPTITKSYVSTLTYGNIGQAGERLSITKPPNLSWLKRNGVGYYVDTAASEHSLFKNQKGLSLIYTGPEPYNIWRIAGASKIFTANSNCVNNIKDSYFIDAFKISYDAKTSGCSIRSTTNYSPWWHSSNGTVSPVSSNLGFSIKNIRAGKQTIVLNYRNDLYEVGKYVSLVSIGAFIWLLLQKRFIL